MTQIRETIVRYVSIWNETNPERRRELIAATWSKDGTYRDPLMRSDDRSEFELVVSNAQAALPGHTIKLTTGVDVVDNTVRFGWSAVNDITGDPAVTGVDFGVIGHDGRLQSIAGFHDQAPVLAEGN
jgi:hypothetical protein